MPVAAATSLDPGDIAIVAVNTDNNDRFAFVALVDIEAGTEISFTDEGWTGTGFRGTSEDTGTWTAPAGGIVAGTVVELADLNPGMQVSGGGTWSGDDIDDLSTGGDQILAYQVLPGTTNFLAGIGAGAGNGNWIDAGLPDANESYVPAPLGLGTNVVGFTADNGYFSGLSTNTASGLARYASDESEWTVDSSTRVWPAAWLFTVNDELSPGDIAFVGYNADGAESFAVMAVEDIPGDVAIAFTDEAWSNDTFVTSEDTGTWIAPGAGVAKGTIVTITNAGATMSASAGVWVGGGIVTINASGDQLLAHQGHATLPHFLAGVSSTDWITSGSPENDESYLPASLTLGVTAVEFDSELENGYFNPNKTTGSRWGYLTAIHNAAAWVRNDTGVTYPSWSFSVADTPSLNVGEVAFVAFQTDDPDRFAFVAIESLSAGTEVAFTDTSYDGTNLVVSLNEQVGVWTVPGGGISQGTVVEIDGTNVTGGGSMSGALDELSPAGDQIFAFQGYVTNPVFIAGLCTKNWSTIGSAGKNNSYLPGALTDGVYAVDWTAGGELDNGYYSGSLVAADTATMLALINDDTNWTRDNNTQSWPSPWRLAIGPQPPGGTLFKFR